jgi:pyrimidine deaminase RibD-like protein
MMALAEAPAAAGEATALVTMLKRAAQRWRDRACSRADFDQTPPVVVAHDDPGCVAGQTLRRSGRNAHAALEHGLPSLVGVDQDGGVDVHNDL